MESKQEPIYNENCLETMKRMSDNSELANIALNSNALSVISGLAAEYERCYQ